MSVCERGMVIVAQEFSHLSEHVRFLDQKLGHNR